MSSAKITLLGFYRFLEAENEDLFKLLELPNGINKETLINDILLRSSEFEVLYSDPYLLQNAIGNWSNKWRRTFEKWVEAISIDFAPLENYDRFEEWTDTEQNHTDTNEADSTKGNSDILTKVSAYNANDMQPKDTSETNNSVDVTSNLTSDGNVTRHHSARLHGNIGVTTSTQMLEDFLRVEYWNIYEHIGDVFMQEFVIPIY